MSRNFELLRALKEDEIVSSPRPILVDDAAAPPTPRTGIEKSAILKLAQRLFILPGADAAPRTVLLCSVGDLSHSATLALQLADTLASSADSSVCLVDANFHSSSLQRLVACHSRRGLTEAMCVPSEVRSFVQHLSPSGIWFLPVGSFAPDPHAFPTEDRLRPCLAGLRAQFDRVLLDAPPLGLHEDAFWLGRLTDGVVLILEAGATRRDHAERAKSSFDAAGVKVLGAVLTGHTAPIPKALDRFL